LSLASTWTADAAGLALLPVWIDLNSSPTMKPISWEIDLLRSL